MRPAASPAMAPRPCRACARPWRSAGSTTPRNMWASPAWRSAPMPANSTRPPPSSTAVSLGTANPLAGAVIAFDLDGTLVDTAPDLIGTLNVLLRQEGLRPQVLDDARPFIG